MIKINPIAVLGPLDLAFAFAIDTNPAKAVIYYNVYESAGELNIETSGAFNLPAQSGSFTCSHADPGTYFSGLAALCLSCNNSIPSYVVSGPSSFSAPNTFFGSFTSRTGIDSIILGGGNVFGIDSSYVSGQPIVSKLTASGKTLADLLLTPSSGTLGTWTPANTGDTIQVRVFNPSPGPLPVLVAGAAFGFSRCLRQRIQRSNAAANA